MSAHYTNISLVILLIAFGFNSLAASIHVCSDARSDPDRIERHLEGIRTAHELADNLKINLHPTSSLAEFKSSLFWAWNEEQLRLKHQLGELTDEDYSKAVKINDEIIEISTALVDLMGELEARGGFLYIIEAREGSPLEGYESGYVAILDGKPYHFGDGDNLNDVFSKKVNTDWPPKQLISEWRKKHQEREPDDADNPVNPPETPKNQLDD